MTLALFINVLIIIIIIIISLLLQTSVQKQIGIGLTFDWQKKQPSTMSHRNGINQQAIYIGTCMLLI